MKTLGYSELKSFVCGYICSELNSTHWGFENLACNFSPDVNLSVIEGETYVISEEAKVALNKYETLLGKVSIPQEAFYKAFGIQVLDFESVCSFIGKKLAEGYDYDEALQFGVLAAEMDLHPDSSENYVDGRQFTLSEKADSATKEFFSLCEEGKNKYEAYVMAFYK